MNVWQVGTNFRFSPAPDSSYTATLVFYKAFDTLSSSTTTNHILTNHPDVSPRFLWTLSRGFSEKVPLATSVSSKDT